MVETEHFRVDLTAKRVTDAAGRDIRLTPTEWAIVELLARHPGKLVSQRQLLHEVWGPQYATETNYLRVYLAQIRRKLEPDPPGRGTSSPSRAWAIASKRDSGTFGPAPAGPKVPLQPVARRYP